MKTGLMVLVTLVFLLTPQYTTAKPVNKTVKTAMRYVVGLSITYPDGKAFCSGTIAKGPDNKVSIWTAAHCCGSLEDGVIPDIRYAVEGSDDFSGEINYIDLDDNGKDICRLTPVKPLRSPLRVGPEVRDDQGRSLDDVVMILTRQPEYIADPLNICDNPIMMFRLGLSDVPPFEMDTIYNGVSCPGTSGSPIFNEDMTITHIVSAGLRNFLNMPVAGTLGAPFRVSEWFLDALLKKKGRPLPHK